MKDLLEALAPGSEDLALARAMDAKRVPAHIAIIMDGNGRWAQQRNLPRVAGHKQGVPAVRMAVETCAQLGVGSLTLYAFSMENWKRPRFEVDTLWRLLKLYLRSELDLMMRHDIRFTALGRLEELPAHVSSELADVTRMTSANRGLRLNLAINYGGRAELVDAVKALVSAHAEVTEQSIAERLYTAGQPDPDLLIRTSGEMRISNFLLWQIAYAELYVTETLWPDFTRTELLRAILDYQKRDRRYGGVASSESSDLEPVSLPAR
jgi:undecaprenyl diphosphate synthase